MFRMGTVQPGIEPIELRGKDHHIAIVASVIRANLSTWLKSFVFARAIRTHFASRAL